MGKYSAFNITGALAAVLLAQAGAPANAADPLYLRDPLADQDVGFTLPAVSGPNGKIELSSGFFNLPTTGTALIEAQGSYSVPVGHSYGLQGDVSIFNVPGGIALGGGFHAFTRDPDKYLAGIAAGVVRIPSAMASAIGPEVELYMGDFSLEAWFGLAHINYDAPALADLTGAFAIADVAYYPNDNLRLSIGASHFIGYNMLRLGAEYQVQNFDTPFSLVGDARFGQDGAWRATAGIKFYLGTENKPLKDRHRQDDPDPKPLDIHDAAGPQLYATPATPTPPLSCATGMEPGSGAYEGQCVPSDPEAFCDFIDGYWNWNGEEYFCDDSPPPA